MRQPGMFLCLLLVLLLRSTWLAAQTGGEGAEALSRDFRYNRTEIHLRDSTEVRGGLLRVTRDSVTVLTRGGRRSVCRDTVQWIRIESIPENGEARLIGLCAGAVLGGLLSAGVTGTANQQSFLPGHGSDAPIVLAACGVAGLIVVGAIWVRARLPEREFDMNRSPGAPDRSWDRLRRWVGEEFVPPDFHLTLACGFVNTHVHEVAGTSTPFGSSTSSFNIVRSLSFTYTAAPAVELGASYALFGEPEWMGPFWDQTLNARGVFAVGSYDVARLFLPDRLRWNCGAGCGPVWVHFDRTTYVDFYYPETLFPGGVIRGQSINETAFGATLFTRFEAYLSGGFSVGVFYEYTTALGLQKIESFPEAGMDGGSLGNSSYGLAVGIHF